MKGSISDLVNYIRSTATFQNYENNYGQSAGNAILHQLEDEYVSENVYPILIVIKLALRG